MIDDYLKISGKSEAIPDFTDWMEMSLSRTTTYRYLTQKREEALLFIDHTVSKFYYKQLQVTNQRTQGIPTLVGLVYARRGKQKRTSQFYSTEQQIVPRHIGSQNADKRIFDAKRDDRLSPGTSPQAEVTVQIKNIGGCTHWFSKLAMLKGRIVAAFKHDPAAKEISR